MSLRSILEPCIVVYTALILIELFVRRHWLRFVLQAVTLLVVIGIALLVNNAATGRVAFGQAAPPVGTLGIMFLAIVCGIAARYIFDLRKSQFSVLEFLKPIVISPIVLLPLIGSVLATGELNGMQVVSFALLAFQNGFFWKVVLEGAKPTTASPRR
ncbi:MAG: hypothetical protein WBQ65_25410 [Bryobacteraceae bacterium]